MLRLNRTKVELKPLRLETMAVQVAGFESNQSGIETDSDKELPTLDPSGLNRTKVELKLGRDVQETIRPDRLNRTKVELKHGMFAIALKKHSV